MSERMDTCASCRFYQPRDIGVAQRGECRRHAPTTVDRSTHHQTQGRIARYGTEWPHTMPFDWCGEYEARRG